jgi:hypothetical protein
MRSVICGKDFAGSSNHCGRSLQDKNDDCPQNPTSNAININCTRCSLSTNQTRQQDTRPQHERKHEAIEREIELRDNADDPNRPACQPHNNNPSQPACWANSRLSEFTAVEFEKVNQSRSNAENNRNSIKDSVSGPNPVENMLMNGISHASNTVRQNSMRHYLPAGAIPRENLHGAYQAAHIDNWRFGM